MLYIPLEDGSIGGIRIPVCIASFWLSHQLKELVQYLLPEALAVSGTSCQELQASVFLSSSSMIYAPEFPHGSPVCYYLALTQSFWLSKSSSCQRLSLPCENPLLTFAVCQPKCTADQCRIQRWQRCFHRWVVQPQPIRCLQRGEKTPYNSIDMLILEQVQRRAMKMIKRLKHVSYEEGVRKLGLLSLEKRRPERIFSGV